MAKKFQHIPSNPFSTFINSIGEPCINVALTDSSGNVIDDDNPIPVKTAVEISGDFEFGAVQLMDATTDSRATIKTENTAAGTPTVLVTGGQYNASNKTFDNGDAVPFQFNNNGNLKVLVTNTPIQGEPTQWVNTTNVAAGTTSYPSLNGEIQTGSAAQFYIKLVAGANNTVTLRFYNIEDASSVTTPLFITDITDLCIVSGLNKTNTTAALQLTYANASTNNATFAVTAGQTLECMVSLPDFSYTRVKADVVTTNSGSASNTVIIIKQNKPIGN